MDAITTDIRLNHWISVVQECNSSGLPKRQWCQDNHVDEKQFYYWQRRIRTLMYQERLSNNENVPTIFADLPIEEYTGRSNIISEVTETSESQPSLRLSKGNISIEINNLSGADILNFAKDILANA